VLRLAVRQHAAADDRGRRRAGDRSTNEPPVRHDQIVRLLTLRFADVGSAEDHVHDGLAPWQQTASNRVPFVAMPP
jgi:hypothetical protein